MRLRDQGKRDQVSTGRELWRAVLVLCIWRHGLGLSDRHAVWLWRASGGGEFEFNNNWIMLYRTAIELARNNLDRWMY